MLRQSTGRRRGKNAQKKVEEEPLAGSQEDIAERELLTDSEIDPAEFFDPEEFGFKRRAEPLGR